MPDATVGGGNVVKVEPEAKLRMKSQIMAGAASGEFGRDGGLFRRSPPGEEDAGRVIRRWVEHCGTSDAKSWGAAQHARRVMVARRG